MLLLYHEILYLITQGGILKWLKKKWVSLGEFTSYDLNNKEKEYLKIMSSIPNFDKREKKKCKKLKRRRKK